MSTVNNTYSDYTNSIYHIRTDLQGRYTYVNDKFLDVFGHLCKDNNYNCIGLSIESSIIPEDLPKVYAKIKELLANPTQSIQLNIRKRFADNSIANTYWNFSCIINAKGIPEEIECIGIDFTKQYFTEKEVRENESKLRQIISSINDVLYLYCLGEKKFEFISCNCLEILGVPEPFVYSEGSFIQDYVHEADIEKLLQVKKNIYSRGEPYSFEYRIRVRGEYRWIIEKGFPVTNDAGNTTKYSGVFTDVTELKNKEIQLEQQKNELDAAKQKLESIFNEMEDVVWSVRLPDYKMLFMTPSSTRLYGIPYEEFMTDSTLLEKAIYEEDKAVVNKIQQQLDDVGHYEEEYRIQSRDGKVKWVSNKGRIIRDVQGNPSRIDGLVSNITKRKTVEKSLIDSRERLIETQKLALVGRWKLDLVNDSLHWSDTIFEIFEIDKENFEPTYEGFLNIIHPDDRILVNDSYKHSLETKQPYEIVHRLLMPDGRIKWLKENCRTDYDNQGKALQSVGVVQDISKLKEAELAIARSKEQFQSLVQNIPGITYRCKYNADYTMLYISDQVEPISGYPADDFINNSVRSYASIVHPDDAPWANEELARCIDANLPFAFEYRIKHKDGSLRWVFEKGLAIRNDKNEVIYLDGFIIDITERKKSEEQLRKSNERFQKIAEATVDVVWDWDVENDSLYLGDAFKTLFGHDLKNNNTILTTWYKHIHPEDFEKVSESLQRLSASENENFAEEYRYKKADNTYTYVLHKAVIIRDNNGNATRIIGVISDNPERKRYEEELLAINKHLDEQSKELKRSNEELEQFAFITSHDLQEPLRMVTSFMDLLNRKYGDQLDEKGRQYIHYAKDGAIRMKQIIQDLLLYSRVNKPNEQLEWINLNDVVSEFIQLRRKLIAEKRATVNVNYLPKIETHEVPLQQIFHCLLDNALKYTRENEPPVIDIEVEERKGFWQFSIKDNGIGIDQKFFEKIFVIFQRLHNRDKYDGTGIGLSIAKRAVEFLGGEIWVESELGVGTTFYFTIPRTNN